ncbi:unnamed protein product [Pelagomonas calceolata]|uniref:Protein C10 n=1 Tax=Pelagomonas calceolata TaxID=35677 RepID=A0A8J2SGY7_9STRA|nr:unnamed protein product [Pelagomonas calceolata]
MLSAAKLERFAHTLAHCSGRTFRKSSALQRRAVATVARLHTPLRHDRTTMAAAPPPMTPEKAKLILKETITLFSQPENQKRLTDALAEVAQLPPEQQPMGKMAKLMPIVTELAGGKLQEYGLPNVMMGVMQIQAVGQQDPVVMEGVQLLTAATMGNVPDAATLQAFVAKCG